MGANEKHAAAYHVGEYSPVTRAIRERYMRDRFVTDGVEPVESRVDFDRWLAGERADAQVEALTYAADAADKLTESLPSGFSGEASLIRNWLRDRAEAVRKLAR